MSAGDAAQADGDTLCRCPWCLGQFPEYLRYHDEEWGVPVHEDSKHFEFLILEGAQAGLSWATVLKRREGYRQAFAGFDPEAVARFDRSRIEKLLSEPGIIRNRLKVESSVTNAQAFLRIQEEFGSFDAYIWRYVEGSPRVRSARTMSEVPATSQESDLLSKDLKKRGFKFAGSTIVYAHMQACGLVNDHLVSCYRYSQLVTR